MSLWILVLFFLGSALFILADDLVSLFGALVGAGESSFPRARSELEQVQRRVRRFEDRLGAGTLPEESEWQALKNLPAPWGVLIYETASELRAAGCRVLPTLKRLRELSAHQLSALLEGRARSTQALGQAGVCAAMVPMMSVALYFLIPGLNTHTGLWLGFGLGALLWAAVGAAWMTHQADRARWGGLELRDRAWALWAPATIERLLARVESGSPPDLAWSQSLDFLRRQGTPSSRLAAFWDRRLSNPGSDGCIVRGGGGAREAIARLGAEAMQAIQVSLLEGCGCRDRIEAALAGYRDESKAAVERELSLLTTRTLKPLFLCVAPAALSQLGLALALASLGQ